MSENRKEIEISSVEANPQGEKINQSIDLNLVSDMQIQMSANLGSVSLTVEQLTQLQVGEVVNLDQGIDELIALKANGQALAYGRLVAQDDHFALEIQEVVSLNE